MIGAGSWGTAVAVLLARGGLEVQLGTRTEEKAAEIDAKRENADYLPGVAPARGDRRQARRRHRARRRRPRLPRRPVGRAARRRSARSATGSAPARPCCCSPRASSSRSARCRASTSASGSAPARSPRSAARRTPARRPPGWPPSCSGQRDADLRAQLGEVFDRAGLVCERTDDVVGVEMAGAAKNAAALAAAAAEAHGLNAAGIAAATIWRECVDYALAARRPAGDLLRARRGRRPDRHRAGAREPQPPRRRAARRRRAGGPDPGQDRPGVGGARLGAADRRGGRAGAGSRRPASTASPR